MRYRAIVNEQLPGASKIVLFEAPVTEIEDWAGVPQKRRLEFVAGTIEAAGFQREVKASRIRALGNFLTDSANVIQNPLLAAVQSSTHVRLESDDVGWWLEIDSPSFETDSLAQLMRRVLDDLEQRIDGLAQREPKRDDLNDLRRVLSSHNQAVGGSEPDPDQAEEMAEEIDGVGDPEPNLAFDAESQVLDFYDDLRLRWTLLSEFGANAAHFDEFAGFTREFLCDLLRPVVLVDGQHRLRGSIEAVNLLLDTDQGRQRLDELLDAGMSPEQAEAAFRAEHSRRLPVSLMMSSDPAERVFQFVVVNQKATPISQALLGTIVSTTLTQNELDAIRSRLEVAGIEIEGSRATGFMSRAAESPFKGLVQTGMAGDVAKALPWSVLTKLTDIVRTLSGGKTDHAPIVDYARLWQLNAFQASGLVEPELTGAERLKAWSRDDGPWTEFFMRLHRAIRDKFGDVQDMSSHNAWGSTESNLFNLVSLRILTVDFFNFLHVGDHSIQSFGELDQLLDSWIGDLNSSYFNRDWRMAGLKKDQPKVRKAWSEAWAEYRIARDKLPRIDRYAGGA